MNLRRRDVLKIVGLSVTASVLPGCKREAHNLVPFLLPDDESIPGVANWYASVCRECEAGCGTIVRVMEGRAKKIEGNPDHPVNQGKLCARGQASLQELYNPDRLRTPLRRIGPPGTARFEPISWSEALQQWCDALTQSRAPLLIRQAAAGSEAVLLEQFMSLLGGSVMSFTTEETVAVRAATRALFGIDAIPRYDLAGCDYLLSLGAPFLEHWLSPVSFGIGYGAMRQGRPGLRGRFIQIEPRLSLTAASADRWIPIRPGTEGLLVMGLIQQLLTRGHRIPPAMHQKPWSIWLKDLSLERVAGETEVAVDEIARLAEELAGASHPLVLAGGMAAAQTNGTQTILYAQALNAMLGVVNQPGGMLVTQAAGFPSGNRPAGEQTVVDAIHEAGTAKATITLCNVDVVHAVPASFGLERALGQAGTVVCMTTCLDDSTLLADLVLPLHSPLESWGDHVDDGVTGRPVLGLQQPVVAPQYATKEIGDVVLEAATLLGGEFKKEMPWPDFRTFLQHQWGSAAATAGSERTDRWTAHLQQGGWWGVPGKTMAVSATVPPQYVPAEFQGERDDFPFFFYPFPSLGLHRGQGANRPWLQELPDPLTTVVWGSWVEINPATARRMDVREGDVVRVTSPYGSIEAPVVFFPGMRPDLIAMPLGQGHQAYGRYAKGRGTNPLALLSRAIDPNSGRLASGATRVRVERVADHAAKLVQVLHPGERGGAQVIHIERLQRRP